MKRSAILTVPSLLAGAAMLSVASLASSTAVANEAASEQAADQESAAIQTSPPDESLPDEIDWTALGVPLDRPYAPAPKLRTSAPRDPAPAWSRNDRPNGTAAVSLKLPVSPFWDMKAGVDLDVATQPSPLRTPETLPEKLASDSRVDTSQGSAWVSARAPGDPYLADHVAIEARMNPLRDTRLGTGFSKSLPLYGDEVSLTLRHGYYVTQHEAIPGLPAAAAHARSLDVGERSDAVLRTAMDRSAEVSFTDTGTSFVAGQARSA